MGRSCALTSPPASPLRDNFTISLSHSLFSHSRALSKRRWTYNGGGGRRRRGGVVGEVSHLRGGHEGGTRQGSQHRPSGFGVRVTRVVSEVSHLRDAQVNLAQKKTNGKKDPESGYLLLHFTIREQLLRSNEKQFQGGLVFKARRLLHHSTLGRE